jgi:Rhamnan synthesis protein F/Tetratricopeptide repeat
MALHRMFDSPQVCRRRREERQIILADSARDARQWELAARLYQKALDRNPRNSPIWVQYGHALKESGELRDPDKLAQAEAAYRRALSLDPSVADTHLQLGHVSKLQGKTEEAEASYLRAFALDPSAPYPLQELEGLGWSEAHLCELQDMLATDGIETHSSFLPGDADRDALPVWAEPVDAEWYLKQYPDVARAGTDPLEHYINFGRREGRKPNAAEARADGWISVTDVEISCLKRAVLREELALFVTHSPHGRLKPHVPHYLECLSRQSIGVILIVAADEPFTAADAELMSKVDGIFVRQNNGYDFGAWAHVLRLCPEFINAHILYLLNDSVFGPTNDSAFDDLIGRIRNSSADFIGLTESLEVCWHLQSYFLAIKSRALLSVAFRDFIQGIVCHSDKDKVITSYEVRFASIMKSAGLNCEALFQGIDGRNPTIFHWKQLLEAGFPFLKVNVDHQLERSVQDLLEAGHDPLPYDVADWRQALAAQGYDVSLTKQMDGGSAAGSMLHEIGPEFRGAPGRRAPQTGAWSQGPNLLIF